MFSFIWAVITALISRMIINIRKAELDIHEGIDSDNSDNSSQTSSSSLRSDKDEPLVVY